MKKKHTFLLFICLIALIGIERVYYLQNGGFRLGKLLSTQSPITSQPPCEIDALLNQSFRFLDSGGTSFVFLGEDGQTILKLFKHQHLAFNSLFSRLVLPGDLEEWRIKFLSRKEKKQRHKRQDFLFSSCALAERFLKEETGLIYLCLQPNSHFKREIRLIDAWGISHHLDLSQTEFALQKKAELLFPRLNALLKRGDTEEMKLAIDALLGQIRKRCQMGIGDRDPNLLINFGFVGLQAIEVDIGSYYPRPELSSPLSTRRELFLSTHLLQKWLDKHSPDLLDYLLKQIVRDE